MNKYIKPQVKVISLDMFGEIAYDMHPDSNANEQWSRKFEDWDDEAEEDAKSNYWM